MQSPLSWSRLGRGKRGSGGKQKHPPCSFPPGEGRSDQIWGFLVLLSKGRETEGCWELWGRGKPCPSLPSCMSHCSPRRAFALSLRLLVLPPQSVCPALRVSGSCLGVLGCVFTG